MTERRLRAKAHCHDVCMYVCRPMHVWEHL